MRTAARILVAALPGVIAGCATDPMRVWRESLQEYVVNEGNGDPGVLRSADRSPSEADFSVIGASTGGFPLFSPRRIDAHGELVGFERLDDRDWYVFMVGMVQYRGAFKALPLEDPELLDLRPAAVSVEGPDFAWLVGESDPETRRRYCRPQLERWRRSDPGRAEAEAAPTLFPTDADRFRVTVAPDALTVTDEHSGAAWTVPLGEPAPAETP